jgi:hypothetical protein
MKIPAPELYFPYAKVKTEFAGVDMKAQTILTNQTRDR